MNNGHLKIFETVLPIIVSDKPFSPKVMGMMMVGNHIYTNKIQECVNPQGWGDSEKLAGKMSQWATLGNGNCVCVHDGMTEFAKPHSDDDPSLVIEGLPFLGYFAEINEISKRLETTADQIAQALRILTEDFQTLEELIERNKQQEQT